MENLSKRALERSKRLFVTSENDRVTIEVFDPITDSVVDYRAVRTSIDVDKCIKFFVQRHKIPSENIFLSMKS